jgi:hypothetical protein
VIRIELSPEEAEALQHVLRSYLSDLHDEIVHTDSYDYREQLKQQQALLDGLLHRVGATVGSTGA